MSFAYYFECVESTAALTLSTNHNIGTSHQKTLISHKKLEGTGFSPPRDICLHLSNIFKFYSILLSLFISLFHCFVISWFPQLIEPVASVTLPRQTVKSVPFFNFYSSLDQFKWVYHRVHWPYSRVEINTRTCFCVDQFGGHETYTRPHLTPARG